MSRTLLRMTGIAKQFPGVQALDGVAFDVEEGEVHGLLGENGAGKSTLLKIISGALQPDSGTIEFDGSRLVLPTPEAALALGIVTIYQEFNLDPVPHRRGECVSRPRACLRSLRKLENHAPRYPCACRALRFRFARQPARAQSLRG